ncbi:TRAP transporter, 4TM/12TM fusion protein [Halogranum amylolyticum]|uniref:TRAP transporter, 4TM/12TM fusion protein n=1 Tax=Halogranum amylolyticum TaxID=660520 RepID=A0A1H8WAD2_9EURY|nr:TRAP transporter fused permease subunit [Halogranum amylolyticum]SEP24622.1 TRAP transporter, 4TM/12TM fusion protein [Halogranum amylolyticum]
MSSNTEQQSSFVTSALRGLDLSVTVSAIVFWLIVLGWAYTQDMSRVKYGVIFVGAILSVYALDQTRQALEEGDRTDAAVLLPAAVILISASVYFTMNFTQVYVMQQGYALEHEYMLARIIILSILYLTWREFGNLFLGLVGGAIIYGVYGNYAPGILNHGGMTELTLLQSLVTDLYGFYGSLTQLTAAWIAPFLLYAGLLFGYGAFDLILRVAIQSGKYIESGVAQTAVLASAVIGSINGSYTANAAMTGSFTIPTMKDSGMAPHRAAGIEAVASTSGQVLPPVMGASAFVMASYLQVAYLDIVTAGLIPAAILVACIGIAVHYVAISDSSSQEMDFSEFFDDELSTKQKLFETVRFGIPFLVLIYLLGVAQFTVMTSALWTIVSMVICGVTVPVIQRLVDRSDTSPTTEFVDQLRNTVRGFRRGAIILAPIAIILVAVNGVIDIFSVTGVPNKIALLLIDLSGGVLLFAVLLAMLVAILMGVGMPTVAAYVIVAILIAPTLVADFGIPDITAHYTVFYAAILAGITPPVATAAVVTAGIAGANFWRVCGAAIKISAPLFILPIAFVYNPAMISMDLTIGGLVAGTLVLMGGIMMIYGLNYPFEMRAGRRILLRLFMTAMGVFVMVYPGQLVKLAGTLVFLGIFVAEKMVTSGKRLPFTKGVDQ